MGRVHRGHTAPRCPLITSGFGLGFVRPMPVLQVSLHLPGITSTFVGVTFLIDSGPTDSCLHPRDATVRLVISSAMLSSSLLWPDVGANHGVGGTTGCYMHP